MKKAINSLSFFAMMTMAGCMSTSEPTNDINAVLDKPTKQVVTQVKQAVATLLNRPEITMLDNAFVKKSWIAIERTMKLSNDPSLKAAIKLQLVKRGDICLIRHESTGKTVTLSGVSCVPEES